MSSFNSPFTGNVIVPTDVSYRSITLSANTSLEWPVNGNATPNYAARIMDVTATTGGLILRMPPANQVSVGQDALIRNVGANAFTVADYDGNVIAVVTASSAKYIYITDNADEAGTWGIIAFGVGSSAADAASLVGYGLTVIGATLNTSHPVQTLSSAYTAVATDRAKAFVWTGGAGVLTLTSSGTLGNNWFILLRNNGTGTLTISPSGGDQINSAASLALQPSDSAIICCSGAAFFTVGIGKSTDFNFTQNTKAVTSGSYVLTASEAANPIQKFTGVLTGNVTVTIPQTVAVYYVSNQTDGTIAGYTITITTGVAGSISAVVPAGTQVILVCDSASLYNASTIAAGASVLSLSNGTVSSPSLNFGAETTTGIYRPASGQFGISILGVQRMLLQASGVTFTGNLTATGSLTCAGATVNGNIGTTGNVTAAIGAGTFNNLSVFNDATIGTARVGNGNAGNPNCTALGFNALDASLSGAQHNTAIGNSALLLTTTGDYNTAVGSGALSTNTTTSANTAVGYNALTGNSASTNTAIGAYAGELNGSGSDNVFIGAGAGRNGSTSYQNVYIGKSAGDVVSTQYNNVVVGYNAIPSVFGSNNQIVIGASLVGYGNNTAIIGGSSGVYNEKNATSWDIVSDSRLKKNIVDNADGLNIIERIKIRNFEYRQKEEITDLPEESCVKISGLQIGVIAQEFEQVLPESVRQTGSGALSVSNDRLIWYLINAVKELSERVKQLEAKA